MKIENPTALLAALKPVDMPIGLVHFDSDFCWCDPTIEVDDYGRDIIVPTSDVELKFGAAVLLSCVAQSNLSD